MEKPILEMKTEMSKLYEWLGETVPKRDDKYEFVKQPSDFKKQKGS